MTIQLNQKEKDKITQVIEILSDYSAMYSALVKGKAGNFHDTAGSAVNLLQSILKEQETQKPENP